MQSPFKMRISSKIVRYEIGGYFFLFRKGKAHNLCNFEMSN